MKQVKNSPFFRPRTHKITKLDDIRSSNNTQLFHSRSISDLQLFNRLQDRGLRVQAKYIGDSSQSLLQVFAMQYLVLCMEEIQDSHNNSHNNSSLQMKYLQAMYQLLQKTQFDLKISNRSRLFHCPQSNLKAICVQFLNYISNNRQKHSIFEYLVQYPSILDIFAGVYRELLSLGQIFKSEDQQLSLQATYDFLASYFGIQASIDPSKNLIYINESNTFAYWKQNEGYYLIYYEQIESEELDSGDSRRLSSQVQDSDKNVKTDNTFCLLGPDRMVRYEQSVEILVSNLTLKQQSLIQKKPKHKVTLSVDQMIAGQCLRQNQSNLQQIQDQNKTTLQSSQARSDASPHRRLLDGGMSMSSTFKLLSMAKMQHDRPMQSHPQKINGAERGSTKQVTEFKVPLVVENKQNHAPCRTFTQPLYLNTYTSETFYIPDQLSTSKQNTLQSSYSDTGSTLFAGHNDGHPYDGHYAQPYTSNYAVPYSTPLPHNNPRQFKANVTKQFTNSIVMRCMAQPYKTSVWGIRERARSKRAGVGMGLWC